MKPLVVFYHCLFQINDDLLPAALEIVKEQMELLNKSGLIDAASDMIVGVNGGDESKVYADSFFPDKARVVFHGLKCRNENRTIAMIEERVKQDGECYIFYFMAKGASFPSGDDLRTRWRHRMQHHVVTEWRRCVAALDSGAEACGCHYLRPEHYPGLVGHPYFGGNFWVAKSSFLKTLPPISESLSVKVHGIDAFESRYESESWIGHGRSPRIVDFHPGWPG